MSPVYPPRPGPEFKASGLTEREPTVRELFGQLGTISGQITYLAERMDGQNGRIEKVRADVHETRSILQQEMLLIRQQVTVDHAKRLATVEGETKALERKSLGAHTKTAAVYGLPVAAIVGVVFQVLQARWPGIAEFMKGVFEAASASGVQ